MSAFPQGQFGVIYADPPWQYEMYSDKGYEKSPDTHYGCMDDAQLKALRDLVLFASAPNCVLFMWAVWPMLPQAINLVETWGFRYKTGGAWHKKTVNGKTAFGTGYVLRSACEPFLIGTLGEPNIKNHSTRNLIEAVTREHSRKPDETIGITEQLFDGPYLEMFSRQKRHGWESWGNEAEKFEGAA